MAQLDAVRLNQIATVLLQHKMEKEGVRLCPTEIKRDITNTAKKTGIPAKDLAQVFRQIIEVASKKTLVELDSIE